MEIELGIPEGWERKFAKRILLIPVRIAPGYEKNVDEALDEVIDLFVGKDRNDQLIDDMEKALRALMDEMFQAEVIEYR